MTPTSENGLRSELTPLPRTMWDLPVFRGYPTPWFCARPNGPLGEPEFRAADGEKWMLAVRRKLCWVDGHKLGSYLAFVLGPMCGVTRTTSEPPSHRECALWSVRNCPFLTRPHMGYRKGGLPEEVEQPGGFPIDRNPGVSLVWVTRSFKVFDDGAGKPLISVGDPVEITCWAEGRTAKRDEIQASIDGGLPHLRKMAEAGGPSDVRELGRQVAAFQKLLSEV